ncbi:MAG: flagellar biosynthetic protein FliO [Roseburia sp.]|nr:flagellar biosynthetic protein FliO [Ruminococcus sp.]MCM1156181.1 flagellar biosynthetic protein FliO [Roseburia sp.]MCM1241733.1 flagellar biosynthetic protein FliO [Roseburia sp.]
MILTVSDSTNSYLQFVTILIIFVFVLAITYLTTRWISGYQRSKNAGTNLEVIESFRLADNKYIQIIRVGQKYLAVALGKDSVTMLTEIPEEQLILSSGETNKQLSFKELFEKVQKKTLLEKEDDRNKSE